MTVLAGHLSVTNSTVASNETGGGGSGGHGGSASQVSFGGSAGPRGRGAIWSAGSLGLSYVTVASNAVGDAGAPGSPGPGPYDQPGAPASSEVEGGVAAPGPAMSHSIVASNEGSNCSEDLGPSTFENLFFPSETGCPRAFSGDPRLQPLADNGGPTRTMALGAGSAALDRIPAGGGCPSGDQRGVKRPQGAACDVGAFESTVLSGARGIKELRATRERAARLTITVERRIRKGRRTGWRRVKMLRARKRRGAHRTAFDAAKLALGFYRVRIVATDRRASVRFSGG